MSVNPTAPRTRCGARPREGLARRGVPRSLTTDELQTIVALAIREWGAHEVGVTIGGGRRAAAAAPCDDAHDGGAPSGGVAADDDAAAAAAEEEEEEVALLEFRFETRSAVTSFEWCEERRS